MLKNDSNITEMRDFILFVAYRACSGRNFVWGNNPFQYRNAIRLIAVIIIIHIVQLTLFITEKSYSGSIDKFNYLLVLGLVLFLPYLLEPLFSKRVLTKSISRYKGTLIDKRAKFIAYGYLVVNFLFLLLLMYLNSKAAH